ncbi:MAG: hypothetical protein GY795_19975 [Desulfobacterales bacterium]|nr:hypothetical protein [Desulfobacterales bacterium]
MTALLETYAFSGNIRELKAVIVDAVTQASEGILSSDMIRSYVANTEARGETSPFADMKLLPTLKHAACLLVEEAMKRANRNQTLASKILGISQPSLNSRLKKQKEWKKRVNKNEATTT